MPTIVSPRTVGKLAGDAANRTTLENKLWLTFLILNSSGTWRQIKSLVSDRDLFTAARSAGNVKN